MRQTPSCFGLGLSRGRQQSIPADREDDAMLAKELNALSMEEREKVYEEVCLDKSSVLMALHYWSRI